MRKYRSEMRNNMKIAICDDEKQFIDAICPLLEQWAAKNAIKLTLHCFTNGDDLIAAHRNKCMDLIILDIIMPLLNGMDTARELRNDNQTVPIIFLTSTREFAVDSYEVKAFHYLIKPVDEDKLFRTLDDFLKTITLPKNLFTAQTDKGFCKIVVDDVEYLEAQNKEVLVHLSNGKTIMIRELFSKCAEMFSPENGFFRCHRSYIVNLNCVEQFSKKDVITNNNTVIPISRNNFSTFKETYFKHMFG